MIVITGRRSKSNNGTDTVYGEFSVQEIGELIRQGGRGMLSMNEYTIDGVTYTASGLSIGDETIPVEQDGKIVVPTYFRRYLLAKQPKDADPEELVKVEVVVDPSADLYVTIVGV